MTGASLFCEGAGGFGAAGSKERDVAEIELDVRGEVCPVPLVEVRKALRKISRGDIIEVVGDHPASKKEIPMAVQALGRELLSVEEEGGTWKIRIRA